MMLLITDERAGKVRHLQAADDSDDSMASLEILGIYAALEREIPEVGLIWIVKSSLSSMAGRFWVSGT